MTATVTDLFCGAGGSSLGAENAGLELVMAANHWQTAIDVHQTAFPNARHDCADISQVDPRRYPTTDVLLASPECTNHSQAKGVSRKKQQPGLFDQGDPSAERSRATMWDVPRLAEQIPYAAIVVENVVEATKWVMWPAWLMAMEALGYDRQILSHNSMHHGVPQSRDRLYVVFTRAGLKVDLEFEHQAHCERCNTMTTCRQAWKNGRTVGRYRTQWVWACTTCGRTVEPETRGARDIIDWALECPRIGDRKKPLAERTRARIFAGLQRHGWAPITTAGAGNTYETTPGNRAKPVTEPLPTQQTSLSHALATPPSMVVQLRGTAKDQVANSARPIGEPLGTVSAGGMHHGLLVSNNHQNLPKPLTEPLSTVTTGNRHGLLMRNNTGGGEMTTSVTEPARTMTAGAAQSLLVPYRRGSVVRSVDQPSPTLTTRDALALLDPDTIIDDCGFRMLEPYEVAAAMAFPPGHIPVDIAKKFQVRLAGNAVTPPVMTWITGRILHALAA